MDSSLRQGCCLYRLLCQAIQSSQVLTKKFESQFLCRSTSRQPVLKIRITVGAYEVNPSKMLLQERSSLYFLVLSFVGSLVSSVSYLELSRGAVQAINLSRSFMLDRRIFDLVSYSNSCVNYTWSVTPGKFSEQAYLATESVISFPK